jgi:hypothetical protein
MTIINGIEIDIGKLKVDETRLALLNNYPIEDKLHVIAVVSNPCSYARRYILAREFIARMQTEESIHLYVVELAYDNQEFYVAEKKNKRHLQLRADTPLWHKETMINVGVSKLLPANWRAFAWIDMDLEFESTTWATDALKVLNGSKDVIQLFSHCIDMDKRQNAMSIFPSFGFQYAKGSSFGGTGINMWHPGFAWAMTRKAYEKLGGLYDKSILGAGDNNMAFSFIGNGLSTLNESTTDDYKESIRIFETRASQLRLGYIPGLIRHHFHGFKKNRQYNERWKILVKHAYSPILHVMKNKDGLIVPTKECPPELLADILNYFSERNEDEGFKSIP